MKCIAHYAFSADTVPKGSRKPRRQLLFGTIELDIAEVPRSETTPDAVVLIDGYQRNRGTERFSLLGWDGRLWRPRSTVGADSPDALVAELRNPSPIHYRDNPVSGSYDPSFGPRPVHDYIDAAEHHLDENFVGQILRTDKSEAAARVLAAARDLAIIDGTVHVREREPVWSSQWYSNGNTRIVRPRLSGETLQPKEHLFRPDRAEDAREFSHLTAKQVEVKDAFEHVEREFLTRDDLSHFVRSRLRELVLGRFRDLLPYLSAATFESWSRAAAVADRIQPFDVDKPLTEADAEAVIRDVTATYEGAAAVRLPSEAAWRLEEVTRNEFKPFMARVKFEHERLPRPSPSMSPPDEAAIATLGLP